jgi:hypothetical protein
VGAGATVVGVGVGATGATNQSTINVVAPPSSNPPFNKSEIDFDVPLLEESQIKMDDEPTELKDRREIYLKLYREAKEKAKMARNLALMAYLEKNEIKNTYMLDDVESDEDDDELYD